MPKQQAATSSPAICHRLRSLGGNFRVSCKMNRNLRIVSYFKVLRFSFLNVQVDNNVLNLRTSWVILVEMPFTGLVRWKQTKGSSYKIELRDRITKSVCWVVRIIWRSSCSVFAITTGHKNRCYSRTQRLCTQFCIHPHNSKRIVISATL